MLTQFAVFAVLCASVCLSAGAYLLVRYPKLVERYAMWFGSLKWSDHTTFAVVFGMLALIQAFDQFWFGAFVFGAVACMYAYFAVRGTKQRPEKEAEST